MKVALGQMEVVAGKPRQNLETMLAMIEQAKEQEVDIIAFPEMAVGGYLLGDKWLDDSWCEYLMEFNEKLREASNGIGIVYGNVFLDAHINDRVQDGLPHPNKDGRTRKYNAMYAFQNGEAVGRKVETNLLPKGVQPKTLLPNYRMFDDERYFFSTQDIAIDFGAELESLLQPFMFEVDGKKVAVGLETCEDLWCADYRRNLEALNPTSILIENGAEVIFNGSSSPWTFGKNSARDRRVAFLKEESGDDFVPFYYVNCTGAQNNGKNIVTFDGGSTVYNAEGKPVVLSQKMYQPELMVVSESDLQGAESQRVDRPRIAQKYDSIIEGINHVRNIRGKEPRFVIGLSGGIDSAVTAALLVQAVGKENVFAVNMPTQYNSEKTKDAAEQIATNLGITYAVAPIEGLVEANTELIRNVSGHDVSDLLAENIQAKIRSVPVLSNLAQHFGALYTSNGNKAEIALGYFTLDGDGRGAIAPIGDLTKTEVVDLARYLNQVYGREVIPSSLIPDELHRYSNDQIKPSAELKNDQEDPIKFGYHCALVNMITDFKIRSAEDILTMYKNGTLHEEIEKLNDKQPGYGLAIMERWGLTDPEEFVKDLEWFDRSTNGSVFKRIQSQPNIITSKTAYGFDRRESMLPYEQTFGFDRLKADVLQMDKYEVSLHV